MIMPVIRVPYGNTFQQAEVGDAVLVTVIDPKPQPVQDIPEHMLKESMDHPIGSQRLEEMVSPRDRVAVVVNDQTRPGPNQLIVKEVISRLRKAGVPDGQVTFVFATGSHRAPTEEEQAKIVGEDVREQFRMVSHDCLNRESLAYLGRTSTDVPIYINKVVQESTFVVTTGLIAPHHSAGFSGGRKSIVPGVAGFDTLHIHHSLPIRPAEPAMGFMEGNPFHVTALEAAKMVPVRFIVNAVQDAHKQNIAFVSGDLEKAHTEGTKLCRKASEVVVDEPADIVVASPGGAPRDNNLYQAQKALSVAEKMAGKECTFILVAECSGGYGEGVFRQWLEEADTPQEVVERFRREGFNVGSNKAFMYARAMTKGRVIIVSDVLNTEDLHRMMLEHAASLQQAVDMACTDKKTGRMIVMPQAVNIIPRIRGNEEKQ